MSSTALQSDLQHTMHHDQFAIFIYSDVTKKDPSPFLRLVRASPGQFTHCLFLMIIAVATLNFAVIILLHPQDNQFDWLPSYQQLLVIESAFEPTKRVGIGSKHFRSEAHKHNVSSDCHGVASDAVLEEWKGGKQTVCSIASPEYTRGWFGRENNTVLVEEYVLRSWEYEPTFVRYQNVEGYWGRDMLPIACPSHATLRHEHLGHITQVKPPWLGKHIESKKNESEITEVHNTVIQVKMFQQSNPYERFHGMLNAAMVMRMLDIENPQLVLLLNQEGPKAMMTNSTLDMWRSFSDTEPIIVDIQNHRSTMEKVKRFRELIHLSSSGTSMITTNAKAFKGRGTDHHCKSTLFRDIVQWMAMNYNIKIIHSKNNNVTQVIWSTRRKQQYGIVKRTWRDEDKLLGLLRNALGPAYNITPVDFGQVHTARQSIVAVSQADIMVGVHGAGLMWAAFMPIHGGLIEIFGGDRASNNRHYHNVASLADLHYREISLGGADPIQWDERKVNDLVNLIRSISPRHKQLEPG